MQKQAHEIEVGDRLIVQGKTETVKRKLDLDVLWTEVDGTKHYGQNFRLDSGDILAVPTDGRTGVTVADREKDNEGAVAMADAFADNSTVGQLTALRDRIAACNSSTFPNREAVEAFLTRLGEHITRREEGGV